MNDDAIIRIVDRVVPAHLDNCAIGGGTTGSATRRCLVKVFEAFDHLLGLSGSCRQEALFIDVGANDGRVVLSARGIGYKFTWGVEAALGEPIARSRSGSYGVANGGLANLFETRCSELASMGVETDGAKLLYSTSVARLDAWPSMHDNAAVKVVFQFDFGFRPSDRHAAYLLSARDPRVKVVATTLNGNMKKFCNDVLNTLNGGEHTPFTYAYSLKMTMRGSGESKKLLYFVRN